ncbi:6697_t:CDS:2 [Dentiscutata heterogama]|uniref:6697_t:CDS:1 n=1 Tax=Dentiscutata heterogama TaxID=1316150 RepID=A0ACA9MSR5_9GLOM|nr:6697_t:CDS:2 [Dentiscutata heterogama]
MECLDGTDNPEYCDKNRIRAEKNEPETHVSRLKIPLHESDDEVKSHTKSKSNGIGVGKDKPTDSCETLETRFNEIKRDESPVKRKNSAIEETYENDQEVVGACGVWMLKVENIRGDPPSLKKHADEVGDNIRRVKCKDSGNSPSFSNNKVNIKVKRVQMNKRKVRVEVWRFLTMMKLHGLIIETRSADKDRIGSLVEHPFKKNNLGDRDKKKKKIPQLP